MNDTPQPGTYSSQPHEITEPIGYEWLRVPDHIECGHDDHIVTQARQCRIILCRVERFARYEGRVPVAGGVRKVPVKVDDLEEWK